MIVSFYDYGTVIDTKLKYAVILARYNHEWIFVKHKERDTWEIPGGRREFEETLEDTARRELYEETGAISCDLYPLCVYSVKRAEDDESFGGMYYANVKDIGQIPAGSEISQITFLKGIPNELTYPAIQPALYNKALQILSIRDNHVIMISYAERILTIIEEYSSILNSIPEDDLLKKTDPHKWAKKEIIGHLCDSAINNLSRFIRLLNSNRVLIIEAYDQNYWVSVNRYLRHELSCKEIITLWTLLNKQIACIVSSYRDTDYNKEVQINEGRMETGGWLVNDYIEHMLHHLKEIKNME